MKEPKVQETQANRVPLNTLRIDMEHIECEDKSKMESTRAYQDNLQQQLVNKQRTERCQYEDTYCERKMHDGIMGTNAEEDQRELQYKHDETDKRREEMRTFQREKEAWKEDQKEMVIVEDRKIDEQRQVACDRNSATVDKREKKIHDRAEQAEKLGQILLADAVQETQAKMESTSAYQDNLQQQLVNKQRTERCQYEDTYCERKMHDGIMGTNAEEDQRELQYKHDETDKRREEMRTFQREKEAWKEDQKEMVIVEDRKIDEQRQVACDRNSATVEKREKKIHDRAEQAEKLGQILLADAVQETQAITESTSAYEDNLQQQLVNKQRTERCQYEDTYCERKMHDGIMGTDAEEDQRELQYKHDETDKRREEMGKFQREKEAWKEDQKEIVIVEDRKIDEQRQVACDRNSATVEKREKKIHDRAEQAEKLGQILLADATAIREHSDQIQLRQLQECLEHNAQCDIAEEQREELYKQEAKQDREDVVRRRGEDSRRQSQVDASYKEYAEELMAWEDEKENQKELKRDEVNKQYSMDLCKQIEDNACRRKTEHDLEQKRAQDEIDYDAAWRSDTTQQRKNKHDEELVEKPAGYNDDIE